MRGHEVFHRIHTLGHRGNDRHLDSVAGRVLDETLHTGHLREVTQRSAGARAHHVCDRTHRVHRFLHQLLHVSLRAVPDFNHHAALLIFREKTVAVIVFDFADLRACTIDDAALAFRNLHVVERPRDTGLGSVFESEALNLVDDARNGVDAVLEHAVVHDAGEHLLRDCVVDVRVIRRKDGVKQEATDGRLERLSFELCVLHLVRHRHDMDRCAQVNRAVLVGEDGCVRVLEVLSFPVHTSDALREPVGTEHDIERLLHHDNHFAGTRLQDVLVRRHDVLCLPLRLV